MRNVIVAIVLSTLSVGGWADPGSTVPKPEEAPQTTTVSAEASDRQQPSAPVVQNTQAQKTNDRSVVQPPRPEPQRKPKPPLEIKWIEF